MLCTDAVLGMTKSSISDFVEQRNVRVSQVESSISVVGVYHG